MGHTILRRAWLALVICSGLATAPTTAAQDSRAETQLAEDQALLKRQLQRLRQTMEVLAQRFESEGRTHAATLLRDGLKELDARSEELGAKTLDELMAAAQENLSAGRAVQSIEAQEAAVKSLERLYSILTDRRGLEDLQKSLAGLQQIRQELSELARDEARLRAETAALKERAQTAEQRALRQGIERARAAQRALQERTEAEARASHDLDLAAIEREIEELLRDQRADSGVLSAWKPGERVALENAARAAERATTPAARAERLARAASELQAAARAARAGEAEAGEAQRGLERAAEREQRHARASSDAA
ncbi:MAG: hypothetical protein JNK02_00710, partial [Planctomycetes bacterium]|nr:hypothetical protein [Planctomycetota bacterium]